MHDTCIQVRHKISISSVRLCDYGDAYIFVKGTIAVLNMTVVPAAVNNSNKKVMFKNWGAFINCIINIIDTIEMILSILI